MVEKNIPSVEESQLDRMDRNIVSLCTSLEDIKGGYNKIVYALIGVIAATIGVKIAGSPWYIDLAVYFTSFAGVFMLLQTINLWKKLSNTSRMTRTIATLLFLFSASGQIFIYEPGIEPSPPWFTPIINVLLTLLAVSFIISAWNWKNCFKGKVDEVSCLRKGD